MYLKRCLENPDWPRSDWREVSKSLASLMTPERFHHRPLHAGAVVVCVLGTH